MVVKGGIAVVVESNIVDSSTLVVVGNVVVEGVLSCVLSEVDSETVVDSRVVVSMGSVTVVISGEQISSSLLQSVQISIVKKHMHG